MVSNANLHPGLIFVVKVHSLLGAKISSAEGQGFWLLAAFPRSKFKLSEDSVGFLLQSIIGGFASHFVPLEVHDWIFKFKVSSKKVGLLIYQLGFFQSKDFKVVSNLCNDHGMNLAKQGRQVHGINVSEPPITITWKDSVHSGELAASSPQPASEPSSPPFQPGALHCPPCASPAFPAVRSSEPQPSELHPSSLPQQPKDYQEALMAYRFVGSDPFLPRGSHRRLVGFRKPMARVVLGGPHCRNCDVAIVNIEPLPQQDFLIGGSPHDYVQYRIYFTKHNRGWNNKIVTMNCDVWLMLLGFNIDFWSRADIEKTISAFGKLLVWEEDPHNLARIVVKARVLDLSRIPWFIVCSEGEDFEGDSWVAQCEILQYKMLGGALQMKINYLMMWSPISPNQHLNANPGPAPQWGLWLDRSEAQPDAPFIGPPANPQGPQQNEQEPQLPAQAPVNDFLEINDLAVNGNALDIDLNMPIDDDMGGIDNLIQAAEDLEEEEPLHPAQIIDATCRGGGSVPFYSTRERPYRSERIRERVVDIPLLWYDFFTAQLLNPLSFVWAKNFLTSSAMQFFQTESKAVSFGLPNKCPLPMQPAGLDSHQLLTGFSEKSKPISKDELRRSKRCKSQNQGFNLSGCKDKDYIGCSIKPPTFTPFVIRNLGESFCKVDPKKLTIIALHKKKSLAPPGGRKLTKKKPDHLKDDSEAQKISKKKPKK
uniref:Uncharacterized protein n=1 Tax=Setaria viridis TaxID=4556 RepID=A0A4U6VI46_SETVI|nr:hypothetical protein SEVIR_3G380300v2 [Setaria viridis]